MLVEERGFQSTSKQAMIACKAKEASDTLRAVIVINHEGPDFRRLKAYFAEPLLEPPHFFVLLLREPILVQEVFS